MSGEGLGARGDRPAVTAVMPARDDAVHLAAAARSVMAQDYDGPLDLIIAVGPSGDGTEGVAAHLARDGRVSVVANPSGGTGAGLNAAVAAAGGEILVRVDAHCELPPGYVTRAVETMARTGAANVGGVQRAVGESPFQKAVAAAMTSRFGVGDAIFHYGGREGPTDTVYLGVFRAAALAEVGGFDQSLVRNQDYELNIRLREAGHIVWFDPALEVRYHPRDTLGGLSRQYFEYGRWKREVVRRRPGSTRLRQVVAPATVLGIATGVALGSTGRRFGFAAPAVYAAAVVGAAVTDRSCGPRERCWLAAVYPTMHMSWGLGFLLGPPRAAFRD